MRFLKKNFQATFDKKVAAFDKKVVKKYSDKKNVKNPLTKRFPQLASKIGQKWALACFFFTSSFDKKVCLGGLAKLAKNRPLHVFDCTVSGWICPKKTISVFFPPDPLSKRFVPGGFFCKTGCNDNKSAGKREHLGNLYTSIF